MFWFNENTNPVQFYHFINLNNDLKHNIIKLSQSGLIHSLFELHKSSRLALKYRDGAYYAVYCIQIY